MAALLFGELRMSHEPQGADSVRYANQDYPLLCEVRAIVQRDRSASDGEPSTVNPDHYRQTVIGRFRRGPDVEVEAILVRFHLVHTEVSHDERHLNARRRELVSVADCRPGDRGFWRPPTQVAQWRRGKWDTLVHREAAFRCALDQARFRANRLGRLCAQHGC